MMTVHFGGFATASLQHRPINHYSMFLLVLCLLALWLTCAPEVRAADNEVIPFSIPAQALDTALTAYADAADVRVLFVSSEFNGLKTQGLSGTYNREEALRRLLEGTGVSWEFSDDNTVQLQRNAALGISSAGKVQMSTILVSGEKMERSLRDTTSSVAVSNTLDLEQQPGLRSTDDILQRTPNVVTSGTDNFAPAVRGIDGTGPAQGADAFFAGTRPRLNVQIDGRPASYNEVSFGDVSLWDVDQIEVYRGAQSTLQGRNAIGGAVIVSTKDPSFTPEYSARMISGKNEYRQTSAMATGPLSEDIAYRIVIDQMQRQSFVKGFNSFQDVSDPGDIFMQTLRGKVLYEPKSDPGFSTLFTLTDARFSGPQTEGLQTPYDEHVTSFPDMPVFEPSSTSGILESRWEFNKNFRFENSLSFTKLLVERLSPPGSGIARIDGHETVLEPRLYYQTDDASISGFAGVYFFHGKQNESIDLFGGGKFDDDVHTTALFGEFRVALNNALDLIAGARIEREHHVRDGVDGPFVIDLDETYNVFLPKLGLSWDTSDELTLGITVSRGYNGGGAGFTYDVPFTSYTFDPEYVTTWEAFARAELLDNKLSLNANLFYSKYKDFQLPFDLNDDPDIWSFIIENADRVNTYGLELGALYQATSELRLTAGLGLLETEIKKYDSEPLEGNRLPRAPGVTANFGLTYLTPSGWEFSADSRYTGSYHSSVKNLSQEETDHFWVINTQLGYVFDQGRIFAYANNLFQQETPIMIEAGDITTTADDTSTIVQPRPAGVGLEVWF